MSAKVAEKRSDLDRINEAESLLAEARAVSDLLHIAGCAPAGYDLDLNTLSEIGLMLSRRLDRISDLGFREPGCCASFDSQIIVIS